MAPHPFVQIEGISFMQADAGSQPVAGGQRIALFDNIKGVLIILVVLGHMMHPIHNDNPVLSAAFDIIYLFHMPLFVFVSGLFAKSTYRNGRLNVNRIISFMVLGLAFQMALLAFNGDPITLGSIICFPSAPWYLIAMGWWSALTPALSALGAKAGIAASTIACLAGGLIDLEGGLFAISRTIAFLPWFALGYYTSPNTVASLKRNRLLWAPVLVAFALVAARAIDPNAFQWFFPMVYGDTPYAGSFVLGMIQKTAAMLSALIVSLAVIKLIPERRSWLSRLGTRTLQVYILHRLIRAALTFRTPFYDASALLDPVFGTFAIVVLTALTIALTSTSSLESSFNGFIRATWIQNATAAVSGLYRVLVLCCTRIYSKSL